VERDVEHEALLLMSARQAGVRCTEVAALASLADGSMALALENVSGHRLDELSADDIDADLLDAIFREANAMHRARVAHRSLRTANILVQDGRPVIIDASFAKQSAPPRLLAIDRAELLASLAALVGVEPVVAAAARVLDPDDLAAAEPYLQPLALSSATRHQVSKPLLKDLRAQVAAVTGEEPPPL